MINKKLHKNHRNLLSNKSETTCNNDIHDTQCLSSHVYFQLLTFSDRQIADRDPSLVNDEIRMLPNMIYFIVI